MSPTIYAMIPARAGSERLKIKNLSLLDGKPLISYSILAAKDSGIFNKIIINSDNKLFKKISERYGVNFYLRPAELGGSTITTDEVVLDFMYNNQCDILVWLNPISPLQTGQEIMDVVRYFIDNNLNSLITVIDRQAHCVMDQKPINFSIEEKFKKTQDLTPIREMVYSVMMWKRSTFITEMELNGHAILHGKVDYYPVSKLSSLIVKTAEDLNLINYVISSDVNSHLQVEYDELANKIINNQK